MIRAFILGMYEFRSTCTTGFSGQARESDMYRAYDLGRDLAHRLTARKYEEEGA
jgi:hypothetical protein